MCNCGLPRNLPKRDRRILCCGIGWFTTSAIIFAVALVLHFTLPGLYHDLVVQNSVITGKDSIVYQQWVDNEFPEAPPFYECYSFYNLTNKDDVLLHTAKPILNETGPYCYRLHRVKVNPEFINDGKQIKYYNMVSYHFDPSQSKGDPMTDVIISVNPTYLAILAQTDGELALSIAFNGVQMKLIFDTLSNRFVDDALLAYTPQTIDLAAENAVKSLQTGNMTHEQAELKFYAIWANQTTEYSGLPQMQLSLGSKQSSGLSLKTTKMLFDKTVPNSLVYETQHLLGGSARLWMGAPNNLSVKIELMSQFGLESDDQLNMIASWLQRDDFKSGVVVPQTLSILAPSGIKSLTDFACGQWGMGSVWKESIKYAYPDLYCNECIPPEYHYWARDTIHEHNSTIPLDVCNKMFYGNYSMFSPINFGAFVQANAKAILSGNYSVLAEMWGMTEKIAVKTDLYFLPIDTYKTVYGSYTVPTLESIIAQGYGMFKNQTVNDWIFVNHDELLGLMTGNYTAPLKVNDTSVEFVLKNKQPNIIYTGVDDDLKVMEYTEWEGQTVFNGGYEQPIPIKGKTDDGFYSPYFNDSTVIQLWDETFFRPINVIYTGERVNFKGIEAMRYSLDNETMEAHYFYNSAISGFVNLTSIKKAPLFLSYIHMFNVDRFWINKVEGMQPNWETDMILAYVAPILGRIVMVNRGVQANFYVDKPELFNFFSPKVTTGLFYPAFYARQRSEINDPQLKVYRSKVVVPQAVLEYNFYILATLAGASLLVGISLAAVGVDRCKKHVQYQPINDA
jgi:hypothetical protein